MPLFPLNVVLFPGMPLTLHIFEDRYKRLVSDCIELKRPFGVVLIRRGQEAGSLLAEPHDVGCLAHIVNIRPLELGQMDMTAIGETRFRIQSLSYSKEYLCGKVELYPLLSLKDQPEQEAIQRLKPYVGQYLQQLNRLSDSPLDPRELPDEPVILAYLASVLLQVPLAQKQTLLSTSTVSDMLDLLFRLYRREVPLLEVMSRDHFVSAAGNFSIN